MHSLTGTAYREARKFKRALRLASTTHTGSSNASATAAGCVPYRLSASAYSLSLMSRSAATSPGTRGSQRAGNGTYRRTRSWVDVKYVVRPYYPQDNGTRPASRSDKPAKLDVDGWWGSDTTRGLQYINRHKPDGVVSSQPVSNKRFFTAATTGWEWVPDAQAEGSQIIATLQRAFKVDPDGFAGGDTAEGMRGYYGLPAGRVVDRDTVRAMQRAINRQLGY